MIQMGEIVPLGNSRTLKFGHSRNRILIFGHSGTYFFTFTSFFFLRRRFIEISKILYRIVENKDIRKYNMIETKVRARVNIDC